VASCAAESVSLGGSMRIGRRLFGCAVRLDLY
jgi:hypothetical protein